MIRVVDLRLRALLGTLVSVALATAVVQGLGRPDRPTLSEAPASMVPPVSHSTDEVEVAQRFQQAVAMLQARRYGYAIIALKRVLTLRPDLPEAHVNMGFALLGEKAYEPAREFFLSAIELRPAQLNAYWGLAVTLERLCDVPGARVAMETYQHLAPPDDPFLRRAGAAIWEWSATLSKAETHSHDPAATTDCGNAEPG